MPTKSVFFSLIVGILISVSPASADEPYINVFCSKIPTAVSILQKFDPESLKIEMKSVSAKELPLPNEIGLPVASSERYDVTIEVPRRGSSRWCTHPPEKGLPLATCALRVETKPTIRATFKSGGVEKTVNLNLLVIKNAQVVTTEVEENGSNLVESSKAFKVSVRGFIEGGGILSGNIPFQFCDTDSN